MRILLKNFLIIFLFCLSLTVLSCSSGSDGGGEINDGEPFSVAIISPSASQVTTFIGGQIDLETIANYQEGDLAEIVYQWYLNDSSFSTEADPGTVEFETIGEYIFRVEATDAGGHTSSDSVTVTVTEEPEDGANPDITDEVRELYANITTPGYYTDIEADTPFNFKATASGGKPPYTYLWNFDGAVPNMTVEDPAGIVFDTSLIGNSYNITFTVTDSVGDEASEAITITIIAPVSGDPYPIKVGAGRISSCALISDGAIKCWGTNGQGQLGNGTTDMSATPVPVSNITNAADLSVGYNHSCAILEGGTLQCWGRGEYGQLGDGDTLDNLIPANVTGLSGTVMQVGCGYDHSCALLNDGKVWCWGRNQLGQLGDGTGGGWGAKSTTPVLVTNLDSVIYLGVGHNHNCAITEDGTLKCWGGNYKEKLGIGPGSNQMEPVEATEFHNNVMTTPESVVGGTNHTCVNDNNGDMWCWGSGISGELGDGTGADSDVPVQVLGVNSPLQIAADGYHTCALMPDETAMCWGQNSYNEIGYADDPGVNQFSPVLVTDLANVKQLADGYYHNCALVAGSKVKCWGLGTDGQLGDGNSTDSVTPVDVVF